MNDKELEELHNPEVNIFLTIQVNEAFWTSSSLEDIVRHELTLGLDKINQNLNETVENIANHFKEKAIKLAKARKPTELTKKKRS